MTLPRRRRPIAPERQANVANAMNPGSLANRALPQVAPVPYRKRQDARSRGITAVVDSTARSSKIDQFTLTTNGAQALTLTYLPLVDSYNVSIRSLAAFLTNDYTVTGQTLNLVAGDLNPLTGDKVQVQYDYLTGLTSATSTAWVDAVTALGPLAWWRLDDVSNGGTMLDSSGHAHHGTWNAVTSQSLAASLVPSDPNQALLMTGTGGEGAVVASAAWMNLTSNLTWLVFFKTTDTSARLFAREQTSGGGQDWSLQLGGSGNVYFVAGGSVVLTSVATGLNDGNTHMAVFTYDGANVKLYVDGTLNKTQAYSSALGTTAMDILIGYGGGTTTSHMFAGTLDEAIMWSSALTAANVTALWAAAQ